MGFIHFMTSVVDSLFSGGATVDSTPVPTAAYEDDWAFLDDVALFGGIVDNSNRPNDRAPIQGRSSAANGEEIGHGRGSISTTPRPGVNEVTEAPKTYCFTPPQATRMHDHPDSPVAVIETPRGSEA